MVTTTVSNSCVKYHSGYSIHTVLPTRFYSMYTLQYCTQVHTQSCCVNGCMVSVVYNSYLQSAVWSYCKHTTGHPSRRCRRGSCCKEMLRAFCPGNRPSICTSVRWTAAGVSRVTHSRRCSPCVNSPCASEARTGAKARAPWLRSVFVNQGRSRWTSWLLHVNRKCLWASELNNTSAFVNLPTSQPIRSWCVQPTAVPCWPRESCLTSSERSTIHNQYNIKSFYKYVHVVRNSSFAYCNMETKFTFNSWCLIILGTYPCSCVCVCIVYYVCIGECILAYF